MRLKIHHTIGKKVCSELKESGLYLHEKLFLFGNLFPDLIHSYLWRRHEYMHSREFFRKGLDLVKKRPVLFSFHLGVLSHYICDYFCYPHSTCYDKGLIQHIIYEIRQKIPKKYYKPKFNNLTFSIDDLDKLVEWYSLFRSAFFDDEYDFHIAATVTFSFLQAAL